MKPIITQIPTQVKNHKLQHLHSHSATLLFSSTTRSNIASTSIQSSSIALQRHLYQNFVPVSTNDHNIHITASTLIHYIIIIYNRTDKQSNNVVIIDKQGKGTPTSVWRKRKEKERVCSGTSCNRLAKRRRSS